MGLIFHYITIAFRNMWKFKSQMLISVTGLAVGLVCFSVATFWIVHEMTFDGFHKNAKRLYVVVSKSDRNLVDTYEKHFDQALTIDLKETFPEIVNATSIKLLYLPKDREVTIDDITIPASIIRTDSSFFRMFDVRIIAGSTEFLIPGSNKIAVSQEKARQLFGNEHPIGKLINGKEEICAIVTDMSKRSNYSFDFIRPFEPKSNNSDNTISYDGANTIIELLPGTNMKAFEKKLSEYDVRRVFRFYFGSSLSIIPLTKLHYLIPDNNSIIPFQYIKIFALCGLLIIISALFNYLTLFVSRFSLRQKELALRMVFGASGGSMFKMLSMEFILTFLSAVVLGWALIQFVHKPFLAISDISTNMSAIYRELLLYAGGVILISLLSFVAMVSQTCAERRKPFAIHKIYGATAGDILAIFAKEYFLLLMIGAAIAFTAVYFIMQRWLEQYVKQTSIPAWIYLSILCMMALVIVLCVGWQVYRVSVENPAEVVKRE
jgi:hypothetical protein